MIKEVLVNKELKAWNNLQEVSYKKDLGLLTRSEFDKAFYTWKTLNDLLTDLGIIVCRDDEKTLIYDCEQKCLFYLKDLFSF